MPKYNCGVQSAVIFTLFCIINALDDARNMSNLYSMASPIPKGAREWLPAALVCGCLVSALVCTTVMRPDTALVKTSSSHAQIKPIRGIHSRVELGALLEAEGAKTGAELGVQASRRRSVVSEVVHAAP